MFLEDIKDQGDDTPLPTPPKTTTHHCTTGGFLGFGWSFPLVLQRPSFRQEQLPKPFPLSDFVGESFNLETEGPRKMTMEHGGEYCDQGHVLYLLAAVYLLLPAWQPTTKNMAAVMCRILFLGSSGVPYRCSWQVQEAGGPVRIQRSITAPYGDV